MQGSWRKAVTALLFLHVSRLLDGTVNHDVIADTFGVSRPLHELVMQVERALEWVARHFSRDWGSGHGEG